jgi:response regulator RpfG family c-di-GMP phosphodiesterase/HAMP domain-containing protein
LFIKPHFHAPQWTILVMVPKSDVLAPFYRFKTLFPLVVLITLAMVVLLSSVAIRRSLIPIDSLLEGARQVACGRFLHRVTVESRDEFQDLAQAFNRMSDRLDKQFKAVSARSDVDRAILSLLDTEAIVSKILPSLNLFFPCMAGAITLLEEEDPSRGMTYSAASQGVATEMRSSACHLPVEVQTLLNDRPDRLETDNATGPFSFLRELGIVGVAAWVVLPIYHQGRLIALICLGVADLDVYTATDLEQVRQLAHQLAVALSNAELIRELKILTMGTLDALARTVDAKSPWTAGHSERVMQLSLQIGKAMGLSAKQLTDMHHAALLHDIGKIGIPVSILDKKEPLTDDEFARIRTHPSIGARILNPIAAYQRLIPVVEQHHERFDGKGYPKGLAGEAIHPAARIMALADAFDAMVSDRPYRKGMPLGKVRGIIQEESGRQFDPKVVAAFERVRAMKFPLAIVRSDVLTDTEQAVPQKVAQGK